MLNAGSCELVQCFPRIGQRVASPHLSRPPTPFTILYAAAAAVHCVPVSLYPLSFTHIHSTDTHAFTRAEAEF